jgi:RNA polymerase sigma factor FliA
MTQTEYSRAPEERTVRMMPAVRRLATRLARRLPRHVPMDDLVAAGYEGLSAAQRRFDPARGQPFEAYAKRRIRGAMLDELRASDPLSRDQRAHLNGIAHAVRALRVRIGHTPGAEEIAHEMGISLETYWDHLSAARMTATMPYCEELDANAIMHGSYAEPADERLHDKERARAVSHAIEALPHRLQWILQLHYRQGLTLRQIGNVLGVSESRISQLCAVAVRRLRELCHDYVAGGCAGVACR